MQHQHNPKTTAVVSPAAKQTHSVMEATPPTSSTSTPTSRDGIQDLSTVELVKQITNDVGHLAQKQIELAKAELKADLKSEAIMVGGLSLAALGAACTLNLLLVTGLLALATLMPGWQAGLIVSGAVLLATVLVAAVAWGRRVRSPLARTKRTLREDVQWTRERLV